MTKIECGCGHEPKQDGAFALGQIMQITGCKKLTAVLNCGKCGSPIEIAITTDGDKIKVREIDKKTWDHEKQEWI